MKRLLIFAMAVCSFAIGAYGQTPTPTPAASKSPAPPAFVPALKVGDMAPDFTLPDTAGNKIKLSELRGKSNVVLAFFVLAFTGG